MSGEFVVEAEPVPPVADRHRATVVSRPGHHRWGCGRGGGGGGVGGLQGIAGQHVLDVHQQELLVLLLVLDAQLHQGQDGRPGVPVQQLGHRRVDVAPVVGDLHDAGTGDQAPVGPGVPGTDGLVVGVEEEPEVRVEELVAGERGLEQEGLEEPGGVGPVPLGGAHVGHGLDRLVLGGQGAGQLLGQPPGVLEPPGQDRGNHRSQEIGHPSSFRFARGSSAPVRADRCSATARTYPEVVPDMPPTGRPVQGWML